MLVVQKWHFSFKGSGWQMTAGLKGKHWQRGSCFKTQWPLTHTPLICFHIQKLKSKISLLLPDAQLNIADLVQVGCVSVLTHMLAQQPCFDTGGHMTDCNLLDRWLGLGPVFVWFKGIIYMPFIHSKKQKKGTMLLLGWYLWKKVCLYLPLKSGY